MTKNPCFFTFINCSSLRKANETKTSKHTKKLPVVKKMNVEKYPSKEEDKCLAKSGRSGNNEI